jgi:hypothetical protein
MARPVRFELNLMQLTFSGTMNECEDGHAERRLDKRRRRHVKPKDKAEKTV